MIDNVIERFRKIVGTEFTLTSYEHMAPYHQATIPVKRRIAAVLQPGSTMEIQEIIRCANEFNIPLYPISTGKNWGYGSANPVHDDNVILDLQRMNRITEVNKELAYAVVEPGVTQRQLYEYLKEKKTDLMMDPTGSGPCCSILGNAVERGYGITPYGDHFESICGMEIVLADGSILRTGFGHFENAKAGRVFKYGVGPYLDGLFTQSNFGIVTKIGVWLMPVPEYFEACYFFADEKNDLGDLIDAVRWLLLNRVVKGSINLVHRNRSLTLLTKYPWDKMQGVTPLSEKIWQELAAKKNVGLWNGVTALYGTKEEVAAAKKVIKRILKGKVTKISFLSDRLLGLAERFPGPVGLLMKINILELLRVLKPSYNLLKGKPCEVSLPTPYWRMKKEPPSCDINPARDNCGLYWLSPVVPMTGGNVEEYLETIEPIFAKHGLEPCITFTAVTPRAFDCTLPILFNKDDVQETRKAQECYAEVLHECLKRGYIPYRFGIQSMEDLVNSEDQFWKIVNRIKRVLDPQGILSPGRYSKPDNQR